MDEGQRPTSPGPKTGRRVHLPHLGIPPRWLVAPATLLAILLPLRGSFAELSDDDVAQVPPTPPATVEAPLPPESPFDPAVVRSVERPDVVVATLLGRASYYGAAFAGRRTSSGERFDPSDFTAAHRTLPFGTRLRVTNLGNGRSVEVRVNDRGPWHPRRSLDLSYASAQAIGMIHAGRANVRMEVLN
jgi:rare lipoprotein A